MSLSAGTCVGAYEITAKIGEGGMGEVWRATDTRLKRQVALKVLPSAFVSDPERISRFQREAEVLASLNHHNIAQIHGIEEADGVSALVLELVEGPTLADRIKGGPLPLDEALPIARQIAEALEAAHEQGVIHRDLKPANIKVKDDGTVKVLDFGLAKLAETATPSSNAILTNSPTITSPAMMTGVGVLLGTAAYMSPEQAKGRPADKRSDIWAFGCVLYEMLTAKRAFAGEDVGDTLAAVLRAEPDWTALPPSTPSIIRRLLRRCVEKDRKRRLDSAADARLEIEEALTAPSVETAISTAPSRGAWIALAIVAVAGMIAMAVPTVQHLRETAPIAPPETRVEINTPPTDQPTSFALSPDGRQLVFVAAVDGTSRLWVRSLGTTAAQPLAGTEGARYPFWSPDGRSIGFFSENALKRLDLGGNTPQMLAPVSQGGGGTWNADGVIVFSPGPGTPLMRVSATGGTTTPVTTLRAQQVAHGAPFFLPNGRQFLFYAGGAPSADTVGIYLAALDGSAPTRLTPDRSTGVFVPTGWLLWVRAGTLVAQRLDEAKRVLIGEPVTVADRVSIDDISHIAASVATTGLVVYRTATTTGRQLMWIDRSGTTRATIGDPDATFRDPRVSPDGQRVAVSRERQGNVDLWLLDGAHRSRFTIDPALDAFPIWSPDSRRLVFSSSRKGQLDLYQKLANGAGEEERFLSSDQGKGATSWSADGHFLLYNSVDPTTGVDLWILPMMGDRKPFVFLKTPFREAYGVFSPDGRWVAYHSNETGQPEIYVRPFVPPGQAATAADANGGQPVSTTGGVYAAWRSDGKELYFLNPAGAMMAVSITVNGNRLTTGAPIVLFPTHVVGGGQDLPQPRQYDVTADGRFLINTMLDSTPAPITLLQNWRPGVKR
jgi:serine/threonine protein kinase/Tol biopolymer transport system component